MAPRWSKKITGKLKSQDIRLLDSVQVANKSASCISDQEAYMKCYTTQKIESCSLWHIPSKLSTMQIGHTSISNSAPSPKPMAAMNIKSAQDGGDFKAGFILNMNCRSEGVLGVTCYM